MKDKAEGYFVVRSQVCKRRKWKSSVSSENPCAIASFTPLSISRILGEDLVFDVLQACESSSLSWISTFLPVLFLFLCCLSRQEKHIGITFSTIVVCEKTKGNIWLYHKKLEVWGNSVDFTLNLNPCILTYSWFIHKGKSEISLNVLQFEFEPICFNLFCDVYTRAQVKHHWRIWAMNGYIMVNLPESIYLNLVTFLQLYELTSWYI